MPRARNHSLTLAAEELYTTQPHGVSMVIIDRRSRSGTALFIRKSKGVELTEAGKRIYSYAVNAVRNAEYGDFGLKQPERSPAASHRVKFEQTHMTLLLTHYYFCSRRRSCRSNTGSVESRR
ncbi:MAG: LysR family transcriptional regulator [Lachnospiraceae bacterium]